MNKKISLGIAISIAAVAATLTFIITMTFSLDLYNSKVTGVKEREEIYEKLEAIDVYVRTNFNGDIDEESLQNAIANGYISGLDDEYAHYYSAEEYTENKLQNEGQMVGVGVTVQSTQDGYIEITEVYDDSPAKSAGIEVGDIIVMIDEEDVLQLEYQDAVSKVKGDEGTKVNLTVRRDGEDKTYELTRKKMDLVTVKGRLVDSVGYISITGFNSGTVTQFESTVNELISDGAKGFIFDVRNNGGGTVNSVVDMLDFLLPEGTLATVTYKNGVTKILGSSDEEQQIDMPMAVLVNGNTASAAELFAATIRDFDAGVLIGATTYGKGVMQNTYALEDGSAVKFTVGLYYPPSSPNYDGVGLDPDYEVELEGNAWELSEEQDTQLQKALEVVNAKIPNDTSNEEESEEEETEDEETKDEESEDDASKDDESQQEQSNEDKSE